MNIIQVFHRITLSKVSEFITGVSLYYNPLGNTGKYLYYFAYRRIKLYKVDLLDLRPLRLYVCVHGTLQRPVHQFPPLISVLSKVVGLHERDFSWGAIPLYCIQRGLGLLLGLLPCKRQCMMLIESLEAFIPLTCPK